MKHRLYRACDFTDAVRHYMQQASQQVLSPDQHDVKLLVRVDEAKLKAKPQIRPFQTYERIFGGG